ncbi:MAG: hypothetical protein JJE39_17970 [Vicinamibacteria bacterium]|nr:hypothetical protein [Vicinamibacteria bacterium]
MLVSVIGFLLDVTARRGRCALAKAKATINILLCMYGSARSVSCPQYINENPFDIESDPSNPARSKQYWKGLMITLVSLSPYPFRGRSSHPITARR